MQDEWNVISAERDDGEKPMCLFGVARFIYATSACLACGHRGSITAENSKGRNLTAIHEKRPCDWRCSRKAGFLSVYIIPARSRN